MASHCQLFIARITYRIFCHKLILNIILRYCRPCLIADIWTSPNSPTSYLDIVLHDQLHRKYNVRRGTIMCTQSSNLKVQYRLKQHIFRRFKAADRRDAFTSRHANHNWMELSRSIEFALLTCCTIQQNYRSDVTNYEAPWQLPCKLLVSQQFQHFCRFRQYFYNIRQLLNSSR